MTNSGFFSAGDRRPPAPLSHLQEGIAGGVAAGAPCITEGESQEKC